MSIPAPALVPAYMLDAINALAKAHGCAEGDPEMQAVIATLHNDAARIADDLFGGKPCSDR